jgi:S-adenosylmethionine:tRNA ribosyltransferase-isomerase
LSQIKQIHIEDYDYPLPDEKIAKYPLTERDKSKLLIYRNGTVSESIFREITGYLPENALIVFNNTRVIRARLLFKKDSGAQIEIFCLEPVEPNDYALNFQSTGNCVWKCLTGNQKRWKSGVLSREIEIGGEKIILTAKKDSTHNQENRIIFEWTGNYTFAEVLEAAGILPIPPYLHRNTEQSDLQTYQTVYSKVKGSVAAPTAGLHFTPELLQELDNKGFQREEITLHVGAGTFKPVQTETIGEHEMHTEFFSVKGSVIEHLIRNLGKIVAVGTTSARTLESLYYLGCQLETQEADISTVRQWQPYKEGLPQISVNQALQNILLYLDSQNLQTLTAATQIIIAPGYEFKIVNMLITNFHQPRSTLLLLVSAFVKGDWRKIYDYALKRDFRFLSYGDSSLIFG